MGFDAQVAGLFWCAGQGGYGIQTAPAMARIAAALAKQQPIPADVAAEGLVAGDLSAGRFHAIPVMEASLGDPAASIEAALQGGKS
jgi:D-arginine dehydrogenase